MIRVVFNQKGGVGKSSITVNLAALSAVYGFRTLVIDLDVQCNTSQYLLGDEFDEVGASVADFFRQSLSFKLMSAAPRGLITPTAYPNLELIAASPDLTELQHKLESKHKIFKLRDFSPRAGRPVRCHLH